VGDAKKPSKAKTQKKAESTQRRLEKAFGGGEVDVLTAGDNDVCDECQDISDSGPYSLDEAEALIPAHPNCRCAFVAAEEGAHEIEDAFDPDQPRDKDGKWTTIQGLPSDANVKDQSIKDILARGTHDLIATERTGKFIRSEDSFNVSVRAKQVGEATPFKAHNDNRQDSLYNPRLATLEKRDVGTAIERQSAVPKEGVKTEIEPLGDKTVLYRGMSGEEWEDIQKTGRIQTNSSYNIGSEQEGATFFSPDHTTAVSYADSFAPWQQKATFDKPAYVVAIRRPQSLETTSPNENEIGFKGPIDKSYIVAAWRGEVYEHTPGTFSLERIGNSHDYRQGSTSSPSNHIAWSRVSEAEIHGGLIKDHIVKLKNGKYRLLSHTGKNLGTFNSHEEAAKHEGEVEWFKAHPKDGSYDPDGFSHPITGAGVLVQAENTGRVLFMHHATRNQWEIPAGTVESGETVQGTAHREMYEETGHLLEMQDLTEHDRHQNHGVDFTTFRAKVPLEFRPKLGVEHDGYAWHDPSTPPQPLHPGVQQTLLTKTLSDADDIEVVPLTRLRPTKDMDDLRRSVVQRFRTKIRHGVSLRPLDVVLDHSTGRMYVSNGHHRLQAMQEEGIKHCEVCVVDEQETSVAAIKRATKLQTHDAFDPDEPRDDHGKWTSGGGSQSEAPVDKARTREIANEIARQLGFPNTRIVISNQDKSFVLNGRNYEYAGQYDFGTKDVTLFASKLTEASAAGVTAHEIEHAKFDAVQDAIRTETQTILGMPKPEGDPFWLKVMRADGSLLEPYKSQFPNYTAWNEAFSKVPIKKFANSDGVSDYSAEWWKAYHDGKASSTIAIHETLAEISRIKLETGKYPEHRWANHLIEEAKKDGTNAWRKLFETINDLYPKIKNDH
jgi:8-oxo-dGTP pyrophosphatase MutT (NUDIX family)